MNLILFQDRKVRRAWNDQEQKWYFAVVDVIAVLTDSINPQVYWRVLKKRLLAEGNETVTNCNELKMEAQDGKMRATVVANAEQLLRLIQSIPSPKAEPFKSWLARVGYERLEEIEDPELATKRTRELYRQKGYSDAWIEKRMRGIAVRDELTDEWKKRGVKDRKEYSILTAEISKAAFGMTPSEYRDFKDLETPGDNLRDHMTDLELIFTMLGEASTTEIARKKDAQGFRENKKAAKAGGAVAGKARLDLEKKTGRKVSTRENYKELPEGKRRAIKRGPKK
ncbi:MAG: Bro-N domain-containing protein [Candidatus Wallbacteria bacterium]|nr:Bro-N domain-containing protein [Candidatus Wallbacteria bacterium]